MEKMSLLLFFIGVLLMIIALMRERYQLASEPPYTKHLNTFN